MGDLLDANLKYGLSKQLDVPQATTTAFNVWTAAIDFTQLEAFKSLYMPLAVSFFIDY